jgi:Rrf2 family protein
MRISAKGRYALAACIFLAEQFEKEEVTTVISISEKLDISKIYLEQVFSLLKRGDLVSSIKGSHGGYKLTKGPESITVYEILASIETAIFEKVKETVKIKANEIEIAMQVCAFEPLDKVVKETLEQLTLKQLLEESKKHLEDEEYMFYI